MTAADDRRHLWTLIGILLISFAVLSALAPRTYPTATNLISMAFQMADVGILALAIGITLLIGAIDLSVVAVANLAAIAAAITMSTLQPTLGATGAVLVALAAGLAVGLAAGLINGLLVSRLRVHPIVITLGTLTLFTGIGTGFTGGSTVFGTGALTPLGRGLLAGFLPLPFLLFVAVAGVLGLLTTRTRWGFRAYMVGASETASRYGRLAVERVQMATYLTSGILAALGGFILLARTNAANVTFGSSFLVLAILVAVLAGVDPYGGSGRIFYVVLAMAAMQQLATGLNMALAGWDGAIFAQGFAYGVLLIAVLGWSELAPGSSAGRLVRTIRRGGRARPPASAAAGDQGSGAASPPASADPAAVDAALETQEEAQGPGHDGRERLRGS